MILLAVIYYTQGYILELNAMKKKQNKIDRRNFLKTVGATGLGSFFASAKATAGPSQSDAAGKEQKAKLPQVPKRKLGKTGVKVPSLSFGTLRVDTENQILLRRNLRLGIDYWDTAFRWEFGAWHR